MSDDKKFVEPVWRVKKPFEPNLELARRIRYHTEKICEVSAAYSGFSIPTIDDTLYSKEVRETAQQKIKTETQRHSFQGRNADGEIIALYKITPDKKGQLKKGFAFIEDVKLEDKIFDLVDKLNENYGAILPERTNPRFVTGEESLDNPDKNYRLVQADKVAKDGSLMFSLFVRYALPEFGFRDV